MQLNIRNHFFSWERPLVMGILNLTPDSFYDGGSHHNTDDILRHCERMIKEGADIIDIGAFSSRPGAEIISTEEEIKRLIPYLQEVRRAFPDIIISIDTFRKDVANIAIDNGADIINDISGGEFDIDMLNFIGKNHIPYIMMHCGGSVDTLHSDVIDDNICEHVKSFFERQIDFLQKFGCQQLILDPGIGFNKSMKSNFELLNNIEKYRVNKLPVLIGISRKSMIYKTLQISAQEALNGTTALNTIALLKGADILRVHDVKEAVEVVKLVHEFA